LKRKQSVADLFQGPVSTFDWVIIAILLISAIMSLGRGLVREATSVVSFIFGGLVAYYALVMFEAPLTAILPPDWSDIAAPAILVGVGFLLAYGLAAFLGGRLARLLHASPEIGLIDRLAGAVFGLARGALAFVLFILLMQQALPEEATPSFVADSRFFTYGDAAAGWIRETFPGFVDRARETITAPVSIPPPPSGQ
jgi:membrane protein required for colicin V production